MLGEEFEQQHMGNASVQDDGGVDAAFDRVLAVECIFHFPSRLQFLKEACRVLRPGGLLALSVIISFFVGWVSASQWESVLKFFNHTAFGKVVEGFDVIDKVDVDSKIVRVTVEGAR